ncbi:hypothetical protein NADFUDRAFT_83500 [Nadsonia fulvescens var. elongata DSM 6958]|uniref:Uncharacterized protein n=1 Tax=Nadsonia fulvescens var. elongata DSM 6958 TaxID=857566 RepID=A0A1E3PGI9_9ASCO|nr:hypothetical protein NADFUDRAFT_83500 [Nadsonia fulvescens var. elongata DSM 6958]
MIMKDKFLWMKRLMIFTKGSSDNDDNSHSIPVFKKKDRVKPNRNKVKNSNNQDASPQDPSLIPKSDMPPLNTDSLKIPSFEVLKSQSQLRVDSHIQTELSNSSDKNLNASCILSDSSLSLRDHLQSDKTESNEYTREEAQKFSSPGLIKRCISQRGDLDYLSADVKSTASSSENFPSDCTSADSSTLPVIQTTQGYQRRSRPRSIYSFKSVKSNSKSVLFSLESTTHYNNNVSDNLFQYNNNHNSTISNTRAHSLNSLNLPLSIISNDFNNTDYIQFPIDSQIYFCRHNNSFEQDLSCSELDCSYGNSGSENDTNDDQDTERDGDTDDESRQTVDLFSMATTSTAPTSISSTSSSIFHSNFHQQPNQRYYQHQYNLQSPNTPNSVILLPPDNIAETASAFSYDMQRLSYPEPRERNRNGDQERYRDELASIITLASSSKVAWYKNTRRSLDTNASIRGIPPMSLFEGNGSRESLAL